MWCFVLLELFELCLTVEFPFVDADIGAADVLMSCLVIGVAGGVVKR